MMFDGSGAITIHELFPIQKLLPLLHSILHHRQSRWSGNGILGMASAFLCWPPFRNSMAQRYLENYARYCLVYLGEDRGGTCATNAFFDRLHRGWREIDAHWPRMCDKVAVYERIRSLRKSHRKLTLALFSQATKFFCLLELKYYHFCP